MGKQHSVGDMVIVGDGPLRGQRAEVASINEADGVAQVTALVQSGGRPRRATAVVSLGLLRPDRVEDVSAVMSLGFASAQATPPAVRGRPRLTTTELIQRMVELYESGDYTHAAIGVELGLSKSTVSLYLRQQSATPRRRRPLVRPIEHEPVSTASH